MRKQTLRTLKDNIEGIEASHPEWMDLPLIYSSDDEGNSYHRVYNDLTEMKAENVEDYHIEMIEVEGDENESKGINCICVN